jgi:hypothetical protein
MSILKSNIKDMVNLMDKLTNRIGKLTNLPLWDLGMLQIEP